MKSSCRILPLFAAFWLLLSAVPVPAAGERPDADTGDERILSFRSEITVLADASLQVRETIRVRAAQRLIRHGIYRDLPTRFRSSEGVWFDVPFQLIAVLRDGQAEPSRTEDRENGVRVYVGSTDRLLDPGEHVYSVTYRTERQLGFFDDHVELHWSVTGHGWTLPIDEAEALIALPRGVTRVGMAVYTGPRDSKAHDATASWNDRSGAVFRTTRPLQPGEGLTVVAKWPKGFVREPAEPQLWWWYFLGSNRSAIAGLAGLLLVLTYYVLASRQLCRNPGRGVVVPRWEAPEGLSPGALRHVRIGNADARALTATLVRMAVAGYLVIDGRDEEFVLRRGPAGIEVLSPEEKLVAEKLGLLRGERIEIRRANHLHIGGALTALKNFLRGALEKFYVRHNRDILLPGALVSVVVLGATLTLEPGLRSLRSGLLAFSIFCWTMGVAVLGVQLLYRWQDMLSRRGHPIATLTHASFIALFAIPFFGAEIVGLGLLMWQGSVAYGVTLLLIALVNVRFHYRLRGAMSAGRLLDRIEGFEGYLAAVDPGGAGRLGPELTQALYERLVPYAVALDREVPWSSQFADVVARAGRSYRPVWFTGGTAALTAAIECAAQAPGTSPGMKKGTGPSSTGR